MPMKAMIYKTLSTVVDDLFAYVFPLALGMHRKADAVAQFLHQDADSAPASVLPGRRCVPCVPVSGMHTTSAGQASHGLNADWHRFPAMDIPG